MKTKGSFSASKKIVATLLLVIILTVSFAMPVQAVVYGDLVFWHGANDFWKYTYGKTTSSETEDNMYFYGFIWYETGPNAGSYARFQSPIHNNTASYQYNIYPGSVIGSSLFDYYVGGAWQHRSTDWWDFDFS